MLTQEAQLVAQRANAARDLPAALALLREMGLDDFGVLLSDARAFPNLARMLPTMAPASVQDQWTGANGLQLLVQSLAFMRALESLCARYRGASLAGKRILDYGCGWGRLMRLALYYTDPGRLYGVDPWDRSIALCREHRVPGEIAQSDYLPYDLPVSAKADVAFAFSVFTHLSERAARTALQALRRCCADDALLIITIRPIEYWRHHQHFHARSREQLISAHGEHGFAYQPHGNIVVDGDAVYGDTSMTHAFATRLLAEEGWSALGFDRTLGDPFQTFVAARPTLTH
jgi:SAM-dependent methyltransferase